MPRDSSAKSMSCGRGGRGQGWVLDDELFGVAAGVEGLVQHAGVEEVVEEPAGVAVEGEQEVVEGGEADPEATAVVAEEVFGWGDGFGEWTGRMGDFLLYVEIKPGVCGTAEVRKFGAV